MKKIFAFVFIICCLLIVGCTNQDKFQNVEWTDGIGFSELAPNQEVTSSSEITVSNENAKLAYIITYGPADLTLEFGLGAADGTEYVKEIVGGTDYGYFENIPSGTYFLVVRNSGDYTAYPSYQDGSENYSATGAINFRIE